MPYVVNGIGTWYWGKRNIYKEGGVCEFCNAFCELASYDTTLYFVIVFIPIFPLGKKRILNQCSRCQQHRVIKLKEWHQNKAKSIEDSLVQFRQAPTPENLEATLSLLMAYQDQPAFEDLAQTVEKQMSGNVDLINTLGAGYEKFGNLSKAEAAYRQSLQLSPSPKIQDILGRVLLHQNRSDEAKSVFQRILTEKKLDEIGYLFLLVEGFQSQGRHQDALDVLDACKNTFPEIAKDAPLKAELEQYQKLSEKNLTRNKKIKAPHLIVVKNQTNRRGEWKARIPGLIVFSLFFILIASYLSSASTEGSRRKFFLVNGLHRPYRLQINGQEEKLAPISCRAIHLPEGTIQFQIQDTQTQTQVQTIQVETSFWSRPFSNYTFVINPDQAALLIREETTYSVNPNPNLLNPYQIYTGSNFYQFENVDYPFVDFPETYSLSSKTATVKKTRVGLYSRAIPEENMSLLWDKTITPEIRKTYFKKQLSFEPNQETYLHALSAVLPVEEMLSFVKQKLGQRPVFVAWHRLYQDLMLLNHPEVSLLQEYQDLSNADPENGDLLYLLGSITPEFSQAKALYQKAVQQKEPSSDAYYALAIQELGEGNFLNAQNFAQQAKDLKVSPFLIDSLFREILIASKQFGPLILNIQAEQRMDPNNGELVAEEVIQLKRAGQIQQIPKITSRYLQLFAKLVGCTPVMIEDWKTYFKAIEIYVDRNKATYLEQVKKMKEVPWASFRVALLEDRLEDAWSILQTERQSTYDDLLLGLVCQSRQKKELERSILQAVIETFKTSNLLSERVLAEAFVGKIKLSPEDVLALPLFPNQKVPVLILLSSMDPENRDRYFDLAKKLNYSAKFPCWIYQEMLEAK